MKGLNVHNELFNTYIYSEEASVSIALHIQSWAKVHRAVDSHSISRASSETYRSAVYA